MSTPDPPSLLLVEDDPDTASLIEETLNDYFGSNCVRCCDTMAAALKVDLSQIDLVLSDMNLPDGSGLDLLDQFLRQRSDVPVVFVTGEGILENAIQAIRRGAYDYIVKAGDYLFGVPLTVEKNLAIWRTKQENEQLQEQLAETLNEVRIKNTQLEDAVRKLKTMAATDPLTGLVNRRAFAQAMTRAFAHAERASQSLACIMLDLDGFKQFNDANGHQCGDELLRRTAAVLQDCCRQSDVPARFGGDEFIVLLPDADERTATQVAHRIQAGFEALRNATASKSETGVTVSMGLVCLDRRQAINPEQLVNLADAAMYRAKQAGRNRLVIHRLQSPQLALGA
jgi:diguanylate cyclase (GGDEF)-like protein